MSTSAVAVYATRYALGRRSGAALDVANFILGNLDILEGDAGCREAIVRDIRDAASLGDDCDAKEWRRVLFALDAEPAS